MRRRMHDMRHRATTVVFRTSGMFEDESDPSAILYAVDRAIRENKTVSWLGYPGGDWRHGWYEDPIVQMRWYSDVISSLENGPYGVDTRRFNLLDNAHEIDCSREVSPSCGATEWRYSWGDELSTVYLTPWYNSIAISNGSRYGLFLYEDIFSLTTTSRYSLEKLISNLSVALLLARWMALMIALYPVDSIGIAALVNSQSFTALPLLLLPRLRSSLEAFWTSAIKFDGDQTAMETAWFTIYPATGEVVLVYFSLLNFIARISRRRMSDVLFGPTLLFFVLLHACRDELASMNLLDGDRRVAGFVTADEIKSASVIDYFTTDLPFRINGRVKTIFLTKLAALLSNLVPLFVGSRHVFNSACKHDEKALNIEKALGIQFSSSGGLGCTAMPYELAASENLVILRPYELVRAGFVVIGTRNGSKLVSVGHWFLIAAAAWFPHAAAVPLSVVAFDTVKESKDPGADPTQRTANIREQPRVVVMNDRSFKSIAVGRISVRAFR